MALNGKFRLVYFVTVCSLALSYGCRKASDELNGKPLSEIVLRYTPQVGQTLDYKVSMNLDKKLFSKGRWLKEGNKQAELVFSMNTVEHDADGYRTRFDVRWGNSNLSKQTMDEMRDKTKAAKSIDLMISDRYVWNKGGTHNLCFPDRRVSPGAEWQGEIQFQFGDLATVNKPTLQTSYRLVKAVENEDGRYCLIGCTPVTDRIEVPLQFGQLGLKCDAAGRVTAVRQDSDAHGKIEIGDILVAVNGHRAATAKDWHVMYERFIEVTDNVGSAVVLTIDRGGHEQDVEIEKGFVTLGTMEVTLSNARREVIFDVSKGIIVSDKASPVYSVMYKLLDEFPFVDDYMGTSSFEGCAGRQIGPRVYHNRHEMKLLQ